ncbi:MAG: hypothetical protein GC137_02800 [Alphaproteobacteria bacterium]|nr:hypothetical protein [Alphaproteobacteria bacterium]
MSITIERPNVLDTAYLRQHPANRGLVIDFADAAACVPEDAGKDYVEARDWRLRQAFAGQKERDRRSRDAESQILAFVRDEDQAALPNITSDGIDIKNPGDLHVAVPDVYDFALSRINFAIHDLLRLYGAERFQKANISVVLQRTDVEPDQAHRPHFNGWHSHVEGGQNYDLVYLFHNVLGTEKRLWEHNGKTVDMTDLSDPDGCMTRIGAEIMHRSQTNLGSAVRREWGAVMVNLRPNTFKDCRTVNTVYVQRDSGLFVKFRDAASQVLEGDRRITPIQPITSYDYHYKHSVS